MESSKSASKHSKGSESRQSSDDSEASKDNGNRTPFTTSHHGIVSYKCSVTNNIIGETWKPINITTSKGSIYKKTMSPSNHSKIGAVKSVSSPHRSTCPCINSLKGLKPKIHLSSSSIPSGTAACDCNVETDTSYASRAKCKGIQSFCLPKGKSLVSPSTLDEFEKHVNKVIDMTSNYQGEGLLCKTENFIKSCQAVKDKIQQFKESRKAKAKLDHLKEQVTNLETITDIVVKEELSSTSIGSFISCCKAFKNKLDNKKNPKGTPPTSAVQKLVNQIDDSIQLSCEAKKKGLVSSESVDEFIKNCNRIKAKVLSEPRQSQKPQTINRLLLNINNIIAFIAKYRKEGSVSESIENFYKSCLNTKKNLTCFKKKSQRDRKRTNSSSEQGPSTQCKSASKSLSFEKPWKTGGFSEKNMCCKPPTKITQQGSNFTNKSGSSRSSLTKWVQCSKSSSSSYRPSPRTSLPKLIPCTKSTCTQCSHRCGIITPQASGFIESLCNSCSEIGKSIISLLKSKNPLKQSVSIVIIKRLPEDHSNHIGISEPTVKQDVVELDSQQKPVTSQESVKLLSVCDASVATKGFFETVRSVKSSCEVPRLYMPMAWSHLSLQSSQLNYNDPFFCGSPQKNESDTDIF